MNIKLKPFTVPSFVIPVIPAKPISGGWQEPVGIALSEVDVEELAIMCDEWREAVFARAGKQDPLEERLE